jgi:Tol biopolymer transport system component
VNRRCIAAAAVIVLLPVLACVSVDLEGQTSPPETTVPPTGARSETLTPAPSQPPSPTVTTQAQAAVLFQDDFSDPGSGWEVGDYSGGSVGYRDGTYFVTALEGNWMWALADRSVENLIIVVDATQFSAGPTDDNAYGVMCRAQPDDDGYLLLISGDGFYSIMKNENGQLGALVDWTGSDAIRQGNATNRIRAICDGTDLAIFVNGHLLAQASDAVFSRGDIALIATSFEEELTQIHFDNLLVSAPWPEAQLWTTPVAEPSATAMPPTSGEGRIAFVSSRDGNDEVYVMNADGGAVTRLTYNVAWEADPSWSPDGARIAFGSDRDARYSNFEIYVMSADGSGQANLSNDPAWDTYPSWSPDGRRIVFVSDRDGNSEIHVMNADGSGQTNLTNDPAWDTCPSWSPTGTRIAFVSNRDGENEIYVINADGGEQTNMTQNPAWDFDPCWSPDGRRVAFTSERDGNREIYVMNADGAGVIRLTNNLASDEQPSWSPDGSRIAFVSDRDGNSEIYVMNADGSVVTRLTNNPASDGQPSWSPPMPRLAPTSTPRLGPRVDADVRFLDCGNQVIDELDVLADDASLIAYEAGFGRADICEAEPEWAEKTVLLRTKFEGCGVPTDTHLLDARQVVEQALDVFSQGLAYAAHYCQTNDHSSLGDATSQFYQISNYLDQARLEITRYRQP